MSTRFIKLGHIELLSYVFVRPLRVIVGCYVLVLRPLPWPNVGVLVFVVMDVVRGSPFEICISISISLLAGSKTCTTTLNEHVPMRRPLLFADAWLYFFHL